MVSGGFHMDPVLKPDERACVPSGRRRWIWRVLRHEADTLRKSVLSYIMHDVYDGPSMVSTISNMKGCLFEKRKNSVTYSANPSYPTRSTWRFHAPFCRIIRVHKNAAQCWCKSNWPVLGMVINLATHNKRLNQ
jgi:hypothetical protein